MIFDWIKRRAATKPSVLNNTAAEVIRVVEEEWQKRQSSRPPKAGEDREV
ncbi:hypothetical protein LQ938_09535 [Microbacterium sp. cx-55]|nr:hypothetical protein [Microbacterium sp. cx-55]MBZ4485996.1 hypothetical protein [Microbacterium sp. cx-55]UGB34130.1 hypothetical protein LQ938_09535 [Microbacterium sp. cx-55]